MTNLYIALHTADPGAAGNQSTSEVNYTGYARLSVARGAGGFTITSNVMNPAATMEFGEMTAGTTQTATHMTIGTATSGSGKVLFRFTISPSISSRSIRSASAHHDDPDRCHELIDMSAWRNLHWPRSGCRAGA